MITQKQRLIKHHLGIIMSHEETLNDKLDMLTEFQISCRSKDIQAAAIALHDELLATGEEAGEVQNNGPEVLPDPPESEGASYCSGDEAGKGGTP